MRLLLVNPRYPESFWSFRWALTKVLRNKRAINPPLGLATLAALCPPDWDVRIVDENVESVPLAPKVDIVGVCGMGVQFARQQELLSYYRNAGFYVVAGGSFVSLCPERYTDLADTVVAGEAEYTWRAFCADFERRVPRRLYSETGTVSLADSPVPRFDLLGLDRYTTATLQFSRGCPYRCEFCDIIVMFGRRPRYKSVEQVGLELDRLRQLSQCNVFFVDDNLIGNRPAAKKLLTYLAQYQRQHGYKFRFSTEVSINLAQDRELLALFREANFVWVFVGIESSDPETLKQARKTQNLHEDVLTSIRRIYSYGIDVLGGFIVGFDNDTLKTFDRQYQFIVESGVQAAMVGLLTALPKTSLYERLASEGRLRATTDGTDNTKPATNVLPKRMSYGSMIDAYEALYRKLVSDRVIAQRIRNKLRHMRSPVYCGEYSPAQQFSIVARLLRNAIADGGISRIWHFARTLIVTRPRKLPLLIVDWITGLSMQDYVRRRLETGPATDTRVVRVFAAIQRIGAAHLPQARITLSLRFFAVPDLCIWLQGGHYGKFFLRSVRHVERLLKRTRATVTLRIDELREQELPYFRRLLSRLARHGDRVSIIPSRNVREILQVDSSIFNLVLGDSSN